MFVSPNPTDPRKYPGPENFYSYFVLKIIFFLRLFRPKIIVFDVLLHSTESDATSLDSDSSQPIIRLVLQEPPETTILLADIFSSVAADGIHFLLSILTKMIDFGQCCKGAELADASAPFELFKICRKLGSHTPRRPQNYIKFLF